MVLDVKYMRWAGQHNLDTAKLKTANVPVYGKWYFPDIPAGVMMVNLHTGELRTFSEPMRAGEILYAPEAELRRAGLYPPPEQPGPGAEASHPCVEGPSRETP